MKPKPKRISESEWKVMEAVWGDPPATVQDVLDAISDSEDWKIETVRTLIGRLVKKGFLTYRKQGNRYLYSPEICREEAVAEEAESFINRISRGSIAPLFAHLVGAKDSLSEEELDELREVLKRETQSEDPS